MNDELLPCPFCGGKAQEITDYTSKHPSSIIVCTACGSSTKRYVGYPDYRDLTYTDTADRIKQQVRDAWNRRTPELLKEG